MKLKNYICIKVFLIIIFLLNILTIHCISFADSSGIKHKTVVEYRKSSTNNFSKKIKYEDDIYYGILQKDGEPALTEEIPEHKKSVEISINTGTSIPPSYYKYSNDGYDGLLDRISYENNGDFQDFGHYEENGEPKYFFRSADNTSTSNYSADGTLISVTYSWDNTNNHPTLHIDEDGYIGDIPKVEDSARIANGPKRVDYSDGSYSIITTWRADYSGTLSKKVWVPDLKWVDNYTGHYSGVVTKPPVYSFKQKYKGTVYNQEVIELNYGNPKNSEAVNEPVNILTGNYYSVDTDITIPDRGLNIEIIRYYNSLDERESMLGKGWRMNYDSSLKIDSLSGDITVIYPDGHTVLFDYIGENNKYLAPETIFDTLIKNTNQTYTLKLQNKLTYIYSSSGKLTTITDKNANSITFQYDEQGNLSFLTSASGKKLIFTSKNGLITKITDFTGRTIEYIYDINGNIKQVKDVDGGIISYQYNGFGITSITDQNNKRFIENEYDEFGRIILQRDENSNIIKYEYDDINMENTYTFVSTGKYTKYKYNEKLYITKKTFEDDTYEEYSYDQWGNRNSIRDRNGNITTYTFDERGSLTSKTSPEPYNYTTTYVYDLNNDIKQITKPEGYITNFQYDTNGNLTKVVNKIDEITSACTTYIYDEYGRLKTVTDPENNTTTYQYDKISDCYPSKIIDPEGNEIKYRYDSLNRKKHVTTAYGTTTYEYNKKNKVTKIIDNRGNITRMKYDLRGNLATLIKPEQYNEITDDGLKYSYEYDGMDRLLKEKDPLENVKAYKYDEEGNKIKEINPNYYNTKTDDGIGLGYEYDGSNRIVKIINPSGEEARIKYDSAGNIIKQINANNYNETIDDGQGTEYIYDSLNRIVEVKDTEGNVIRSFVYDAEGRIVKEIDSKGYLSGDNNNTRYGTIYKYNLIGWLLEKRKPMKKDGGIVYYNISRYKYDRTGKLIEEKKSPEYVTLTDEPYIWNTINYTYDKNGRITTINDSTGAYIEYSYDALGNTTQEKIKINDNNYKIIGYHYDDLEKLDKQWIEITASDLAENGTEKIFAETLYEYDENGNITKIIRPENYVTIFEYDEAGRLITKEEVVFEDSIMEKGTKLLISSLRETVYPGQQYEYKVMMQPDEKITGFNIKIQYDTRVFELVDSISEVTNVIIDNQNNGNILMEASSVDFTNNITIATLKFKIKESIMGTGYITVDQSSIYTDKNGRQCEFVETIGKNALVNYPDMNGDNKVEADDFTLTALLKDVEANNPKYDDKYDISGNGIIDNADLDYIKDWLFADEMIQLTELNNEKFIQKCTNPVYEINSTITNRKSIYEYDKAGNLIKEIDCNGNVIDYSYDEYNRLICVTNKEGGKHRIFYDEVGNMIKEVLPENYDDKADNGLGNSYVYDTMNRLLKVINAEDNVIQYNIYDTNGQVIKTIDAKGYISGTNDEERYGIEYDYDIGGRIKTIITPEVKKRGKVSASYTYNSLDYITSYRDGENNITQYERDLWGRAVTITDSEGIETFYEYDVAGNLVSTTDGNGNRTRYSYNSMNLLSSIIDPEGHTITYKYDKEGRVTKEVDRNGETTLYRYNIDNNLEERNIIGKDEKEMFLYNKDGSLLAAINKNNVDRYEYTPNGYIKGKTRNGVMILDYQYNKNGNVTSITDQLGKTTEYSYDIFDRLDSVFDENSLIASYKYNSDNTVSSIKYISGLVLKYSYDRDKNNISMIYEDPSGEIIENYAYTYDNNGNQISKTEDGKTTIYMYDKLNRLEKVQYPNSIVETYMYDNASNRLRKTIGQDTTLYDYDSRNRLIQSTNNEIVTVYEYDNNGNLLNETRDSEVITYIYDGFNRLRETTMSDGSWMLNEYNAMGLRIATIENGFRYDFTFDKENIVLEMKANNEQATRYTRGINLIAQKDYKNTSSYYLYNAHGDTIGTTNEEGKFLNKYEYDVFGNLTSQTESVTNRFLYSGEQFDEITGQYYLRARYYNPQIGRFIQEDMYRGDGLNLYIYVSNNPVNYVDTTGYSKCDIKGSSNPKLEIIEFKATALVENESFWNWGWDRIDYNARIYLNEKEHIKDINGKEHYGYRFELYEVINGEEATIVDSIVFSKNPNDIRLNINQLSKIEAKDANGELDKLGREFYDYITDTMVSSQISGIPEIGFILKLPLLDDNYLLKPGGYPDVNEGDYRIDVTTQLRSDYTYPHTMRHYTNDKRVERDRYLITDMKYYIP